MLNLPKLLLFVAAAVALLGSPGPGIGALISIGRRSGFLGGLRFYVGLQLGLAAAAGLSAMGFLAVWKAIPGAALVLTMAGTLYLFYLGWRIATAPVGDPAQKGVASTAVAGLLVGGLNPKAYLAFASLFAFAPVVERAPAGMDLLVKWLACVAVMVAVDAAWLGFGAFTRTWRFTPKGERGFNIALGATVAGSALLSFL